MGRKRHASDVVQSERRRGDVGKGIHVFAPMNAIHVGANGLRRVLEQVALRAVERRVVHPNQVSIESARHTREVARMNEHVPAAHVDLVREANRHRLRCDSLGKLSVARIDGFNAARLARGQYCDRVSLSYDSTRHATGKTAIIEVRPENVLHRVAQVRELTLFLDGDRLQKLEHRGSRVPRHL